MDIAIKINIFAFFGFLNAILALSFAFFVFLNNRKKIANKVFGLMGLSLFIWSFFYFLWLKNTDVKLVMFLIRGFSFGAIFIPVFYLHWVFTLLNINKIKTKTIKVVYSLGLFFGFFSFSSFFIKGIKEAIFFPFWPVPGLLYHFWLLFFVSTLLYGIYCLIRNYKVSRGYKHQQILYVLIGSFLGFAGGISNFFLWYDIPVPPFTNFLVSFFVIILAYATLQYRLTDIKAVIRRSTIFLLNLFLTSIVILLGFSFINYFFGFEFNLANIFFILIFLFFGTLIFKLFENYFEENISKKFFSDFYNKKRVINNLIKSISQVLNIEELIKLIVKTMRNIFYIKSIVFLAVGSKKEKFKILKTIGYRKYNINPFFESKFFLKNILKYHDPIVFHELNDIIEKSLNFNKKKFFSNIKTEMEKNNIKIILPLITKNKLVGLLLLGRKIDSTGYNKQDIDILNLISNQLSVALENAFLYNKTQEFNETMKMEVKKATGKLIRINKQLKRLDSAKSEFISIASHQLRTPLTAIKGYSSMLLEGDYGKTSKNIKNPIKNIFLSSERMSSLVENLLDISRIESGKIVFNFEETKLDDLTKKIVNSFEQMIKTKGLKINCYFQKNLPKVVIDKFKIGEVISNLIDNAIKYTSKGGVVIRLKLFKEKNKKYLLLSVKDTGMGIAKNDLSIIFKKFIRGKKVFLVHTEGVGLGMYFSQKVIEAHKGEIWVESRGQGKGSTFFVKLPV